MTHLFQLDAAGLRSGAEVLFYTSLGLLLYVYVLYPVLLSCISLFSRRSRAPLGYEPFLSVLICAYNEEAGIAEKLRQTLALDYPEDKIEIVVVSDGSTDATEDIVRSFADSRVRLLRTSLRRGKTNAQNEGVSTCKGEVIVFSDATAIYKKSALRYLAGNYRDPRVGAVSGRYQYFDESGASPTGAGSIAFWNYENWIKSSQSSIKTITGCCGCIYSVRRDLYTELPADIISDLVQPLCVIRRGHSVVFEDRALAYEATTETSHQEFTMRVRVITRAMRGLLSAGDLFNPFRYTWIAFQLISHKVMRWFVPAYLLGMLLGSALLAGHTFFTIVFAAQVGFYLVAISSLFLPLHRGWKPLGIPLYFCTLNLAAVVSLIELMRGNKYVVWETVRP